MKKEFCKVLRWRRPLTWMTAFLFWGNVSVAALPVQECRLSMQQHSVALSQVFQEIERKTDRLFFLGS